MPSLGNRNIGILPRSFSPVNVSPSSFVDSPERSLQHENGSLFQVNPLVISNDPVNPGILISPGSSVPRYPSSPPPSLSSRLRMHPLMDGGRVSFDGKGGGGVE